MDRNTLNLETSVLSLASQPLLNSLDFNYFYAAIYMHLLQAYLCISSACGK